MIDLTHHSHRRWNALTGEWVLVSPHRTQRPWQGQVERPPREHRPAYDPTCYLCPGNARAGGARNPEYTGTFVFENDFAALKPDTPTTEFAEGGLLRSLAEPGVCKVVCFLPRHDLTLARMSDSELRAVVDAWAAEFTALDALPGVGYVQIFENRGEMMGASNPHPHCQIWATFSVPNEPVKESDSQKRYLAANGRCLLCDYGVLENKRGTRIVAANDHFFLIVPFWAVWPFETLVVSRRHLAAIDELTGSERDGLADILNTATTRYDNLFEVSFPYTMGFHQRPSGGLDHPEWHFHAHFYPPLLRSATVRKFMVGFEMLGMPQRDITPESAAEQLRRVRKVHYMDASGIRE